MQKQAVAGNRKGLCAFAEKACIQITNSVLKYVLHSTLRLREPARKSPDWSLYWDMESTRKSPDRVSMPGMQSGIMRGCCGAAEVRQAEERLWREMRL